jgi:hypothetical protein
MQCALTSDITVFETDDQGEAGSPAVDGFADRAVFADACGYLYKVNPAQNLVTVADPNGWMSNVNYGSISLGIANGVATYALFSTAATALGGQRPIAGTIGARTDSTTDMVLFFGTGGQEAFDPTLQNAFFGIYAKNGSVRSTLLGTCVTSSATKCEKFYGGVVITPDDVILQRSFDAEIGTSTCDLGATRIDAYAINSGSVFNNVFDVSQINGVPLTAVSGPLYGDGGALYFATVSGDVARVGTPRASTAGGDTTSGYNGAFGAGEGIGGSSTAPFTLLGWREVL